VRCGPLATDPSEPRGANTPRCRYASLRHRSHEPWASGEGVSTLELLASAGRGSDNDELGNDALFFIARALQAKVDAVLEWHSDIISPGAGN
jgi:hypothetical protein